MVGSKLLSVGRMVFISDYLPVSVVPASQKVCKKKTVRNYGGSDSDVDLLYDMVPVKASN